MKMIKILLLILCLGIFILFALSYLKNNHIINGSGKMEREWIFTDYIIDDKANIKPHVILTNILHNILFHADWKKRIGKGKTPKIDDVKKILSENGQKAVDSHPELATYIEHVCSKFTELKDFHELMNPEIQNTFLIMQSKLMVEHNYIFEESKFINYNHNVHAVSMCIMFNNKIYSFKDNKVIDMFKPSDMLIFTCCNTNFYHCAYPYENYFIKEKDNFDLALTEKHRLEAYSSFSCSQWLYNDLLKPYTENHIFCTNIDKIMTDKDLNDYLKLEPYDDYNNRYHLFDYVMIQSHINNFIHFLKDDSEMKKDDFPIQMISSALNELVHLAQLIHSCGMVNLGYTDILTNYYLDDDTKKYNYIPKQLYTLISLNITKDSYEQSLSYYNSIHALYEISYNEHFIDPCIYYKIKPSDEINDLMCCLYLSDYYIFLIAFMNIYFADRQYPKNGDKLLYANLCKITKMPGIEIIKGNPPFNHLTIENFWKTIYEFIKRDDEIEQTTQKYLFDSFIVFMLIYNRYFENDKRYKINNVELISFDHISDKFIIVGKIGKEVYKCTLTSPKCLTTPFPLIIESVESVVDNNQCSIVHNCNA